MQGQIAQILVSIKEMSAVHTAWQEHTRSMFKLVERLAEKPSVTNYIGRDLNEGDTVEGDKRGDTSFSGITTGVAMDRATQTISEIHQTITQLQADPETKAGADALQKLAEAISKSAAPPYERELHLRDVKMLSEQAALPKEKRQSVTGALDRLFNFCAGAGGIAAVWTVVGPPILALFA